MHGSPSDEADGPEGEDEPEPAVDAERSDEAMEETMILLSTQIQRALDAEDLATAQRAQRQLSSLQMEKPSSACRILILQDCRKAIGQLKTRRARIDDRVQAVKRLGWWLEGIGTSFVPTPVVLEGLLWALRSEPEVAWTAQCVLFRATRRSDGLGQSVCEGPRSASSSSSSSSSASPEPGGTVSQLLLDEPSPFSLYLPKPTKRSLETYESAVQTDAVSSFFARLEKLILVDPGYGEEMEGGEVGRCMTSFAEVLGRSFESLECLWVHGFEENAMTNFLPRLTVPKLQSLSIMGTSYALSAQEAIVSILQRHSPTLVRLELNIWTKAVDGDDPLDDTVDPLAEIGVMPQLKVLTIRAPPLLVRWEHFAECFPALEELTFLYSQDFALHAFEVLDELDNPSNQQEELKRHAPWLYREAVLFARDLHNEGFCLLAQHCGNLQEIRLAVVDSSDGYEVKPAEERTNLLWRRDKAQDSAQHFRRDAETNSRSREALEAKSEPPGFQVAEDEAIEVAASSAGATAMLEVVRLFDNPSIEADFGLRSARRQ